MADTPLCEIASTISSNQSVLMGHPTRNKSPAKKVTTPDAVIHPHPGCGRNGKLDLASRRMVGNVTCMEALMHPRRPPKILRR
jgi:hypothetical protein